MENYLYLEPQGWQLVKKDTFSYDDQGLLTSAQHASFDYGNLAFVDTNKYYYFCDKLLSEERTANFRRLYEYYQGLDCFDYREPEVTIYPNPAYDNHILVQSPILLSAETKIKLYNAAGILLTVSEVGYRAEKAEITLPDLPNGLYLLSLSALDMQVTKKLVVQH